jgi:Family of unknown function (DUF5677)
MSREPNIAKLRDSLSEAIRITGKVVKKPPPPTALRHVVLVGITETSLDHARAILQILATRRTRSAKVLLRTMMDGWITASYVMARDDDMRAKSYVLEAPKTALKYLTESQRLAAGHPDQEGEVLVMMRAQSMVELEERRASVQSEVDALTAAGVPKFPNIAERAKSLGFVAELTYRAVFSFLLSDQVHAGAGDALQETVTPKHIRDDRFEILATTLYVVTDLAELLSKQVGKPPLKALQPFQAHLQAIGVMRRDTSAPT